MGCTQHAQADGNSAVTELTFNSKRHNLVTYNTLPHLDGSEWHDWITHA